MSFDSKTVDKRTGTLSVLGQILTGLGVAVALLGAFSMVFGIISEFREVAMSSPMFGLEATVAGVTMLLWGIVLSAAGGVLQAIRAIAVNCARIAESKN